MLPFQASDCRSTVSALLMIVHTLSALPFQTIPFLFSWECTFIGLYNAALYKPHNLIFCFKKPYVFRCASISCIDDRHRLTHRNWRFGILNVYSCRTTPLVFYPVGIFVWSVWSPRSVWSFCVTCNFLKILAFCSASLGGFSVLFYQ